MSLLTIIVPTFNRADSLALLLNTLCLELSGLESQVDVVVGDNCSTDSTQGVTRAFKASWPNVTLLRHASNVGPDENFCRCIEQVHTRYFWIIGDDDLPRAGALRQVIDLLAAASPDLVYLESDWQQELTSNNPDDPMTKIQPVALGRMAFARRVHVWSTFISGMVVNLETYRTNHGLGSIRRHSGTNLVQLGWVLGSLKTGQRFIYVSEKCVLAKLGNTGGYAVLKVFGQNFAEIVSDIFGPTSRITEVIIRRCALGYLPGLIWSLRFANVGDFDAEDPMVVLRPRLLGHLAYWIFLMPVARLPRPLSWFSLRVSQLVSRAVVLHDRVLEHLHC
jgi:hypothetical protein